MRRHATAHLGKVERELRPTVIVTKSETLLLGNQEKDARRVKRVPKKFDDYENTVSKSLAMSDSDHDEPVSKKSKKEEEFKVRGGKHVDTTTPEEMVSIKQEVKKMLHVSVDVVRFEHLDEIAPWCMIHKLYKCHCKGLVTREESPEKVVKPPQPLIVKKVYEPPKNTMPQKMQPPPAVTPEEPIDGFSRRVLPFAIGSDKLKPLQDPPSPDLPESLPKIEVVNLADLINGNMGPIIINIYDDKTVRLNSILRTVLNNKTAIIYFDGFAYFVDKTRVEIGKLNFTKMEAELEHPIFIIQPKESFPVPVSSTNADDFVNFLFHKSSKVFVQITSQKSLKSIGEIIESILQSVRRKIEAKLGDEEPPELVKEQLSMITRDRSRSRSVSSANSSPLSFNGHRMMEAPPPGFNTPKMKEFNEIFSVRMKRLVSLVAANTLGLTPSNEMLNKFYIYQWSLLLQSFEEDLVQIWQVTLEGESENKYQMLVLTDTREVPEVEHANKKNIVNIRKLKISDNITELARLILLRVENAAMKNTLIFFYGCKGYMRICGILNSKGCIEKPTRATHPRLAAKIQKCYHLWHEAKCQQEMKRIMERDVEIRKERIRRMREVQKLKDEMAARKVHKVAEIGSDTAEVKKSPATTQVIEKVDKQVGILLNFGLFS